MSALNVIELKDGDGSGVDTTDLENIVIKFIQNGFLVTLTYDEYEEDYAFVSQAMAMDFIESVLIDLEL